ncbi:HAD-IIB family hydrolase [Stutzerimonas tarimensis]|uniref:HAD-IIB family hydrolase n=1 Tax=Stutzerimonas tarimensis TaxID=1507735 RepID=A0ABV7T5G8_9GAMM
MQRLLVYTDLDGTLLDHHSYDFGPALPVLERLERLGVPWIINTSKTFAELRSLRQRLGHGHPFIVENGAAVYLPAGCLPGGEELPEEQGLRVRRFAPERRTLLERIAPLLADYECTGFSQMNVAELQACTGLAAEDARRALQRNYSEPLLWRDSELALEHLSARVAACGLSLLRGGRFVHVMGQVDKATPMPWLGAQYARQSTAPLQTLALGDGQNDVAMLEAADRAVIVRSPTHAPPAVRGRSVTLTDALGPAGWARAVSAVLDQLITEAPDD